MEKYNYDKSCDCIQILKSPGEDGRLRDLREYLEHLKEEMREVEEEIIRVECFK